MKKSPVRTRGPGLAAFGWCLLAVLALMIGGWFVLTAATRHFPLWLYADRYVAAELEVTRFDPTPRSRIGATVEGVIHPGGEQVVTSAHHVAVRQFVDPGERAIRDVPLRTEIEGRRLEVWYWPDHARVARWWHPPTVVMPGATDTGGAVVRDGLLGIALVGAGVYCVRRVWRHVKAAVQSEPQRPPTPAWVGVTIVLLYAGVLGLVVYLMSL